MVARGLAYRRALAKQSWPAGSNRIDNRRCRSAVTNDFEQVAIGIEEIDTIVIAPINRLSRFHPSFAELIPSAKKIFMADSKSMMALAERMSDAGGALRRG